LIVRPASRTSALPLHDALPIWPGGVHDDPRPEPRDAAGDEVADTDPGRGAARRPDDLLHLGVVERACAVPAGREHVLQAEPLREDEQIVEVVAGTAEVLGADRGFEAQRVDRGKDAVPLTVPPRREPVVEREPDPHLDEAA